jgi:O-glycosyl hydrolase
MQRILSRIPIRLFRRLIVGLVILGMVVTVTLVTQQRTAHAASTITVNGNVTHQVIDGFGASDAFKTSSTVRGLSSSQVQQIMDDLFSTTNGAGLTIVRNEIGATTTNPSSSGDSNSSIEPTAPSSPTATPTYVWDGSDNDQVWFSTTAKNYGVNEFYADAWSAPMFMKTNNSLENGGWICGETGSGASTCSSGDWRQAYANYLTQYAKDYSQAGVPLNYIGFVNEPDFTPNGYVGMLLDSTSAGAGNRGTIASGAPQATDFIKNYLGPTLKASGLSTQAACCDATSFPNAATYANGILSDSTASSYLGLITGHAYYASPNGLITNSITTKGQHVWETEASTFDSWSTAWDDGSDASGFQWASNLWSALTSANVNGFLYWWFAENNSSNSDNEAFVNINGSNFTVAARLWAFGNYSRFIHPGATRIDASTSDSNLKVTAFKNTDGSTALVVLNGNSSSTPLTVSLQGVTGSSAVPYLTNSSNNLAAQSSVAVSGGAFSATVPARSLVTYTIASGGPTPTATPVTPTVSPTATPVTPTVSPTATPVTPTVSPTVTPTATPVTPTVTPTATPIAACKVTYTIQSQWNTGFTGSVTIANTGTTAINGWTLKFAFPATGQSVTQGWSATWSQSGQNVTATSMSWNSALGAGGSTQIGFNGAWSGSNPVPTSFTLNGSTCTNG